MDIGEVAKKSGIKPSALRYYESKGLIRSLGRKGLRRYYQKDVLDTLSLISLGRFVGLSLDEIKAMFLESGFEVNRQLLLEKADLLDKKIQKLSAIRDGLKHAANCPEDNHLHCPTFRRYMNLSGRKLVPPDSKVKQ